MTREANPSGVRGPAHFPWTSAAFSFEQNPHPKREQSFPWVLTAGFRNDSSHKNKKAPETWARRARHAVKLGYYEPLAFFRTSSKHNRKHAELSVCAGPRFCKNSAKCGRPPVRLCAGREPSPRPGISGSVSAFWKHNPSWR